MSARRPNLKKFKKRLLLGAFALYAPSGVAVAQETAQSALDQLLRQADFWQENQRPDLARQALERYLSGRPDDPEVLFRLARQASVNGQAQQAQEWTQRLEQVAPNSPRLIELDQLRQGNEVDSGQLTRARQLASANRYAEAASAYQQLFDGQSPPRGLAVEYYQTLAGGNDASWRQAREGLERLHNTYPDDSTLARVLAEVMTYREGTRREGITRLAELVQRNGADSGSVRQAWQQALLWLEATPADEALYQSYSQRYPDDSQVMESYLASTAQTARAEGFTALESGQLNDAEQAFRDALAENPQDAEAKGGLGLILLRRQQFAESRELLAQAMDEAPEQRDQWSSAYQSAAFYARLANARRLAGNNDLEQSLAQVRPLTQAAGDQGRAASLLEADILRRQRRLDAAQQAYARLLDARPNDTDARVGLVQVLADKGEWQAAQQAAEALPAGARSGLSGLANAQVEALRRQASQADVFGAEVALRQAVELAPNDPWARLDLARLLMEQSKEQQAQQLMVPFQAASATINQRHAAAIFASEQESWSEVERLLGSIATNSLTSEMRSLQQQARIQQPITQALDDLQRGNRTAALSSLQALYANQRQAISPGQVNQIAVALADAGLNAEALSWVRRDIASGIDAENPNDYLGHVLAMAQAGDVASARQLLNRLQASPHWQDTPNARQTYTGLAIIEADQLRQRGQLASAYDRLAQPLQDAPESVELLLAMGRVYTDGGRQAQAQQIYNYTLTRHPRNEQALQGAVQAALVNNHPDQAASLLDRYAGEQHTPQTLLLSAQVARANGNGREALAILRNARSQLVGDEAYGVDVTRGANPFINARSDRAATAGRPSWLPGTSLEPRYQDDATAQAPVVPPLVQQIDDLSRDIRRERAPKITTEFVFNLRDGEDGLSRQDRVETPVRFSAVPVGNGRLEVAMTPTQVSSGTPVGESLNRYGRSGLSSSAASLSQSLGSVSTIFNDIQSTVSSFYAAQKRVDAATNEQERIRLQAELDSIRQQFEAAQERNPVFEAGLRVVSLTEAQRELFNEYLGDAGVEFDSLVPNYDSLDGFIASRERIETALTGIQQRLQQTAQRAQPGNQRDSGAGLSLSYTNNSVSLDVGSTPLGFAETNIVGGVSWRPALTDNTSLALNAERREVKDSVLSYAGAHDGYSGETWGGVVRTGGSIGVNYDTDAGGLYADIGAYRYTGNNVADNRSYELSFGGYARPVNNQNRQLQTGVHVSAMSFDEDLSHFTYGHGGYFSPQDYVSVAFPINYRENVSDKLTLGGYISPGFQSYSTEGNDYFPTDPESQALLDVFAALGALPASRYSGESESGVGLSLGGALEYQMTPDLSLGGRIDFNSFGDYNDTSANMIMNYTFGEGGERAR